MASGGFVRVVETVQRYYNRIDGVVLFLIGVLLVLLGFVGYLGYHGGRVGYAIVVAVACALSGGLLGFLFAVPKRKRDAGAAVAAAATTNGDAASPERAAPQSSQAAQYESNTSLEEISDWLTKIIVGVGLVQAQQIGESLTVAGRAVGTGVFGLPVGGEAGLVVGIATIIAFAVLGFLASFLWFRQNLMTAWAQVDAECSPVSGRRLAAASPDRVQLQTVPIAPGDMPEDPAIPAARSEDANSPQGQFQARVREKYAQLRTNAAQPDDWAKGMFGGASVQSSPSRALSATVRPVRGDEFFEVTLTITSQPHATGDVAFFLHTTFAPATQIVALDPTGKAMLTVYAWGAFTVGALMDGGTTELELDLSQLPDAPAAFKAR